MDFVTVSTAGWDDPWVLDLDIEHHHVWHYLIHGPDFANGHGFAERNQVMWPVRIKLPIERIDEILADFERDGKVRIEGGVVWVVRGIHHQRLGATGNNLRNALRQIHTQYGNKAPGLVDAAMMMYNADGVYTGYIRGGLNRTEQNKTKQNKTDHSIGDSDESHPLYELVSELRRMVTESCGNGKAPANPQAKCIETVDRVIRLDKIPERDIKPMLAWALQDEFWSNLIRSIPQWRKVSKANGYPKIHNCWTSWQKRNSNSQPTEREAAERRREERGL